MDIAIAAGGNAFGPDTLEHLSLGGSETAALSVAKILARKGHAVHVFCNLPPFGRVDHVRSGHVDECGVRYMSPDMYAPFISNTEIDLLIVSRQPDTLRLPHQARKAVLWNHDVATYEYTLPVLAGVAWNVDEIWTVSEYHRQQFHKVTGYPLRRIRATRNGIVRYDTDDTKARDPRQLLYAARPERGLVELLRPDGIMSRLPDYRLAVTMYDNFPDDLRPFYNQLFRMCKALPNVDLRGVTPQKQLRQLMRESGGYVYPTHFKEVSCIIARECCSQQLPFITTPRGALPETLGDCGVFVPDHDFGSDGFSERFAQTVRAFMNDPASYRSVQHRMARRDDLDWEDVAEQWLDWAEPAPVTPFSRLWSLSEDGDVVAAIAYARSLPEPDLTPGVRRQIAELERLYPHVYGRESFADFYERCARGDSQKPHAGDEGLIQAIARHAGALPDGSAVLDYGCGGGARLLRLARLFPKLDFQGIDFSQSNVDLCRKYARRDGLSNLRVACGNIDAAESGMETAIYGRAWDAIICSDVLSRVAEPWRLAAYLERKLKIGGKMIVTASQGPWESAGAHGNALDEERSRVWHVNAWMLRTMFARKVNPQVTNLANGHAPDQRHIGQMVFAYAADHDGVHPVDPLDKAMQHRSRQAIAAAIVAGDGEDTILHCLDSIATQVQQIRVVPGSVNGDTAALIREWSLDNPRVQVNVVPPPDLKTRDSELLDTRAMSTANLDTDWIFLMDADEYLSGNIRKYARGNAFDSFAIAGDRLAAKPGDDTGDGKRVRLVRNDGRFTVHREAAGHGAVSGEARPGFCGILDDVEIARSGYVRHLLDRCWRILSG